MANCWSHTYKWNTTRPTTPHLQHHITLPTAHLQHHTYSIPAHLQMERESRCFEGYASWDLMRLAIYIAPNVIFGKIAVSRESPEGQRLPVRVNLHCVILIRIHIAPDLIECRLSVSRYSGFPFRNNIFARIDCEIYFACLHASTQVSMLLLVVHYQTNVCHCSLDAYHA